MGTEGRAEKAEVEREWSFLKLSIYTSLFRWAVELMRVELIITGRA